MKRARFTELWLALAIGLIFATLRLFGFRPIEILELRALDYRLGQRERSERSDDVAIVAVDNASIQKYGRWPWPRGLVAELIEKISAAQPAILGIDAVWSEPQNECDTSAIGPGLSPACRGELTQALGDGHSGDDRLAAAIRESGKVVLGYFFDFDKSRKGEQAVYEGEGRYGLVRSDEGGIGETRLNPTSAVTRNLPAINEAGRARGYFNFIPDRADGLYRRVPMVVRFAHLPAGESVAKGNEKAEPVYDMVTPLSLTMLAAHEPSRLLSISFNSFGVSGVKFGKSSVPVDEDGLMLINYRGAANTFKTYSAESVLSGALDPAKLRDKFVLLGITATAVGDIRATPLDGTFPGVEIHANVLDNILRQDFVSQPAPRRLVLDGEGIVKVLTPFTIAEMGLILIVSLVLAFLLRWLRGVRGLFAAAIIFVAVIGGTQLLFVESGIALRIVYASFALVLTYITIGVQHYVAAERETRETRRVLDLYLSPSVAREIKSHPEMLNLGGEKSQRTVLFSDVKSFTSISEGLDPEELVELLNLYLGAMTDIVFDHDGMLDKYIGDGVMAIWGAPLPQADHAVLTCRAALGMVERLVEVNRTCAERGWPKLEIRIGINSGQMAFGNMGSANHLSLTVMGDNVNLAARLEGTNKIYGSTIIATEATVMEAGDSFLWRELDWVRVRGKKQHVRIFELLGLAESRAGWNGALDTFSLGLEAFRRQQWSEAADSFERVIAERTKDGPSAFYLKRCREYLEHPPGADWEAVSDFGE